MSENKNKVKLRFELGPLPDDPYFGRRAYRKVFNHLQLLWPDFPIQPVGKNRRNNSYAVFMEQPDHALVRFIYNYRILSSPHILITRRLKPIARAFNFEIERDGMVYKVPEFVDRYALPPERREKNAKTGNI